MILWVLLYTYSYIIVHIEKLIKCVTVKQSGSPNISKLQHVVRNEKSIWQEFRIALQIVYHPDT